MKRENVEIGNKRIDTLIGKDSTFTGNIESAGTIRIDGNFEGEISTKGDLVIGENGQVKGKVKAQNIVVAGKMEGELEASGKLELVPSANVQGEVKMMTWLWKKEQSFKEIANSIRKTKQNGESFYSLKPRKRERRVRSNSVLTALTEARLRRRASALSNLYPYRIIFLNCFLCI